MAAVWNRKVLVRVAGAAALRVAQEVVTVEQRRAAAPGANSEGGATPAALGALACLIGCLTRLAEQGQPTLEGPPPP